MRIPLILLLALCTASGYADTPDCSTPQATDQATMQNWGAQGAGILYSEASSIARVLSREGVTVMCIAHSTNQRKLPGEAGSVIFHADLGLFTVAFLPTPKDAADAITQELQQVPQPAWRFVQFQDVVFEVDDPALSATLQKNYGQLVNTCGPMYGVPAWEDALGSRGWETETDHPDPIQVEARALRRDLESHGLHVVCIRSAKEQHLFPGQKNGAVFKTDEGAFTVWFMQDSLSATAAITTITTSPVPISLPSGPNQFFVQDGSIVFHINGCCDPEEQTRQLTDLLRKTYPS